MSKPVLPSLDATAFSCPHCGAYTTQSWYFMRASELEGDHRTPAIWDQKSRDEIASNTKIEAETRAMLLTFIDKVLTGRPFLDTGDWTSLKTTVNNLFLSKCYNCAQLAVWVHERMVFPDAPEGVAPNPDLPDDMARDFNEARTIVSPSPRGAAALLRLVIQKLCIHLGEKGRKIDEDIASLVAKGLDPMVQQALDAVRVIGNDAVHPGAIDLRDDRETALRLFELANIIVTQTISNKKAVEALYGMLPAEKRAVIDARNAKALEKKNAKQE